MNYTVCLDYNSPNYNPANLSPNGFSVYSDSDNFASPITTGIPASLLFPPPNGTCPFNVVGVPNNATQLLIVDQCIDPQQVASIFNPVNIAAGNITIDCCYALITIDDSCRNFCLECEIEFDVYGTNTTGSIIAGNLMSSCGAVTDYVIGWYLNGDYSGPQFTSGFGNQFVYPFTHPLTGNSSPLVAAGNWEGIIHDVIINGTHYTNLASGSGVGEPIPFISCFETIVAEPFTCANGPFTGSQYTHQKSFSSVANGVTPQPVSFTYQLSPSIKYFAYDFAGYTIWDELEIKFISGDPQNTTDPTLYSDPIYLEKIRLGSNAPQPHLTTTVNPYAINVPVQAAVPALNISTPYSITEGIANLWPKNSTSGFGFKRTLTLTNLETSSNPALPDSLVVTVTPNTANTSTNWDLQMQCLEDFECDICTFDYDPPYKISSITLQRPTGNPCIQQRLAYTASGCTSSNDIVGPNSYVNSSNAFTPIQGILPSPGYVGISGATTCNWSTYNPPSTCMTPSPGNVITFSKTNVAANGLSTTGLPLGKIYMTFNNSTDYYHYKNDLILAENNLSAAIGPYQPNCGDKEYYAGYSLEVPFQATNSNCGDNTVMKTFYIHRSSYPNITYVENPGSNFYSITIPMHECDDCIAFTGCTNCYTDYYGYSNFVAHLNDSSFNQPGNQLTYTNTKGAKYTGPFGYRHLTVINPVDISGSVSVGASPFAMFLNRYALETMPFVPSATSTTGWSNLPQLAGTPCPSWSASLGSGSYMNTTNGPGNGGGFLGRYFNFFYTFPNVTASNSSINNDFKVYTNITNNSGDIQTPNLLIYTYSQSIATVHQPQFFVGGAPQITIQPF